DVDQRTAAIDAKVKRAERHRRVIALALRLQIGGMEIRCHQLDLGRAQAAERRGLDRENADLDLSGREAPRHLLAQAALLGRIVANDESHADHVASLLIVLAGTVGLLAALSQLPHRRHAGADGERGTLHLAFGHLARENQRALRTSLELRMAELVAAIGVPHSPHYPAQIAKDASHETA